MDLILVPREDLILRYLYAPEYHHYWLGWKNRNWQKETIIKNKNCLRYFQDLFKLV